MTEGCYDAVGQMAIDGWMDEWMITGDIRRSEEMQSIVGRARLGACCNLGSAVLVCCRRRLGVLLPCFGVESVLS